ncbi:GerAB/ArcD/ProY family transporter [Wukongibacter baidiensis]|uniref:GerAB/ArcD/ProY family transporter n=1 Tax=Wukongibacter baidiensis TaxID=1723361 RepID=UPI003D7FA0F9
MNKEVISNKQIISIIILFIIGPTSVSLSGVEAKKDIWLAVILSMCMALPILLTFCRLHTIFPDKDLFDMIIICFGKFIGKGIIILYIWNLIVTTTTTFRNFGEFITTVSFINTPMIIPIICFWSPMRLCDKEWYRGFR